MTNPALPKTTAVRIPSGRVFLNADLAIPVEAKAIVAFAHGSGSGRHSPRNRYVAQTLNGYKFATLLADLLTEEEEIIDMRTRAELNMGTPFDYFGLQAHTANATGVIRKNRELLKTVMERQGFANYENEWWHFSYPVENPLRFDVVVR